MGKALRHYESAENDVHGCVSDGGTVTGHSDVQ